MADEGSPWKEALEQHFEAFLAFLLPDIHDEGGGDGASKVALDPFDGGSETTHEVFLSVWVIGIYHQHDGRTSIFYPKP